MAVVDHLGTAQQVMMVAQAVVVMVATHRQEVLERRAILEEVQVTETMAVMAMEGLTMVEVEAALLRQALPEMLLLAKAAKAAQGNSLQDSRLMAQHQVM
tara:strand:- start:172 stop:471 length:300 start_codon:yes stop_codon:yes gene_type:complete